MKKLVIGALALCLAGCESPAPISTSDGGREDGGKVYLMAVAPDGTKLWAFDAPGLRRTVFFASSGTQTTVGCGKNCNRPEYVPTAPEGTLEQNYEGEVK
jgi:hypothetical protein